jgi:hypothetical protein
VRGIENLGDASQDLWWEVPKSCSNLEHAQACRQGELATYRALRAARLESEVSMFKL